MKVYQNILLRILLILVLINDGYSCCTGKITSMTVTGSTTGSTVWGTNPYTSDSHMGRAAVHAGILTNGQSGSITLTVVGSLASFSGSSANGVTTLSYGGWCGVQLTGGSSTPTNPCASPPPPPPPPPPPANCTAVIPGCNINGCTNSTYCSSCMTTYGLQIISATDQYCQLCSSTIPNCDQCSVTTACSLCFTGYYVITDAVSTPGQCDLCSNKMPNCQSCSDNQTCNGCVTGYIVNTTTNQCDCDISLSSLSNCLTCSTLTICTSCTATFYYLNATDHLCHSCSVFDTFCLQCSNQNLCTKCQTTYAPKPNTDGTVFCNLCSIMISDCLTCNSPTVCTDCKTLYGLTTSNQCEKCTILHSPECLTCENYTACTSCMQTYVLISGICIQCDKKINKCELCYLGSSNLVQCSQCKTGFYLSNNTCQSCLNLVDYCTQCNPFSCFKCLAPYVLGSDGKCSMCVPEYFLVSGFCMNMPGCLNSIVLPDTTKICLACASQLNFIFDQETKSCVCDQGFKENYQQGTLMSCQSICGDGIVQIKSQQCDDKKIENKDGCDSNCQVEKDFICTIDQPSKCVLHLDFGTFSFNYVSRVLGQNKGILSFSIKPKHEALQKMDWSKLIKFNFSSSAVNPLDLKFSYSIANGNLLVTGPYTQELQNLMLQTKLTFDPDIIVSNPQKFQFTNKLNGINAPLVLQGELMMQTHKNVSIITLIMVIFLLLQFYVGSYFHKMIGLQTIQIIQSIYFVRMVSRSASTSVLSSMNVIQYSASGYDNAEIIYGPLEEVSTYSMGVMASHFTAINLKSFFLMNVNFMLIPVVLACVGYLFTLVRKYISMNKFLQAQQQAQKDRYRDLRRLAQWVYDHFFFPYVMMFNLIIFFFTIEELSKKPSKNDSYQHFMTHSFPVHLTITFINLSIYCYEILFSLEEFKKYRMTEKEREKIPTSMIEKMEHDENNTDRANYHPAYVLVHLIYYLLLSLGMILSVLIESFAYSLELTIGFSIGYFLVIFIWKPYHKSINLHNQFLKLYYGTFVIFLVICYLFSKVSRLSNGIYIGLMYIIMVLIVLILVSGFVRILIEKIYRKKLQHDNDILQWISSDNQEKQKENTKNMMVNNKVSLMINNPYSFENQLIELGKKQAINEDNIIFQKFKRNQNKKQLSKKQQQFLINKIRQQMRQKRQNLILQQLIDSYDMNVQNQQPNQTKEPKISKFLNQSNSFQHPFQNEKTKSSLKQKNQFIFENEDQDKKMLREIRKKLKSQFLAFY